MTSDLFTGLFFSGSDSARKQGSERRKMKSQMKEGRRMSKQKTDDVGENVAEEVGGVWRRRAAEQMGLFLPQWLKGG